MSCVYFLFKGNELLYIGKSTNIEVRLKAYSLRYSITKIRVIKCDPRKLDEYERRLINYFRPRCNKQHNPNMKFRMADHDIFKKRKRKFDRVIIGL